MMPATEQRGYVQRSGAFIRWTQRFLFITGAIAVSYVGLTLLYASFYQRAAGHKLEAQVRAYAQDCPR
jgi:hypothetical protein